MTGRATQPDHPRRFRSAPRAARPKPARPPTGPDGDRSLPHPQRSRCDSPGAPRPHRNQEPGPLHGRGQGSQLCCLCLLRSPSRSGPVGSIRVVPGCLLQLARSPGAAHHRAHPMGRSCSFRQRRQAWLPRRAPAGRRVEEKGRCVAAKGRCGHSPDQAGTPCPHRAGRAHRKRHADRRSDCHRRPGSRPSGAQVGLHPRCRHRSAHRPAGPGLLESRYRGSAGPADATTCSAGSRHHLRPSGCRQRQVACRSRDRHRRLSLIQEHRWGTGCHSRRTRCLPLPPGCLPGWSGPSWCQPCSSQTQPRTPLSSRPAHRHQGMSASWAWRAAPAAPAADHRAAPCLRPRPDVAQPLGCAPGPRPPATLRPPEPAASSVPRRRHRRPGAASTPQPCRR